jgi:hypothetical protein
MVAHFHGPSLWLRSSLVERFESWLADHGIAVAGQFATGSGNMVRYRLRLLDGVELDLALEADVLAERPEVAIQQLEALIERHEEERHPQNGH